MRKERDVRDLLAPMLAREVDLESSEYRVDRERVIARMGRAARRDPPAWLGLLLAAAGIVLVFFATRLSKYDDSASSGGSIEIVVSEGSAARSLGSMRTGIAPRQNNHFAAAGELETVTDSKAQVRTDDGLQLELGSQTRITLGELRSSARKVTLLGGALRCNVPHRKSSAFPSSQEIFRVVAPDVTVIDLGTVFTVSVDSVTHTTRVSVEEGEVVVRHSAGDTHVRAPSTWTSMPSPPPTRPLVQPSFDADMPVVPSPTSLPTPSRVKETPAAALNGPVKRAPAATLDVEARLLRQGLAAERQGRSSEAISALTQLIAKYPRSPLAPDARAALIRIQTGAKR